MLQSKWLKKWLLNTKVYKTTSLSYRIFDDPLMTLSSHLKAKNERRKQVYLLKNKWSFQIYINTFISTPTTVVNMEFFYIIKNNGFSKLFNQTCKLYTSSSNTVLTELIETIESGIWATRFSCYNGTF